MRVCAHIFAHVHFASFSVISLDITFQLTDSNKHNFAYNTILLVNAIKCTAKDVTMYSRGVNQTGVSLENLNRPYRWVSVSVMWDILTDRESDVDRGWRHMYKEKQKQLISPIQDG